MPDRFRGRTDVRTRKGARTAFSAVMRALSDYALTVVPTDSDQHARPTEWITIARRVRALSQEASFRAVTLALESGASWAEIAEAFGYRDRWTDQPDEDMAKSIYEHYYLAWKTGRGNGFTPEGAVPVVPDADGDPDAMAASQDAWYTMRTGGGVDLKVVSGNLY